jgi:hypothetical protein
MHEAYARKTEKKLNSDHAIISSSVCFGIGE